MDEREFDQMLEHLMKQDFSVGTDDFSEKLLARCLTVLNADEEGALVDDAFLDLLAAAGDGLTYNPFLQDE